MKILIALAFITALLAAAGPCAAVDNVTIGEIQVNVTPGDQDPRICIDSRDVIIGDGAPSHPGINIFDYRTSLYAFTGEQIEYIVVVRDPNGVDDIGFLKARVNELDETLGTQVPFSRVSDRDCDGLGRLDPATDKAFRILITVEPLWYDDTEVVLAAYNSNNERTDATHSENWFFNPAISLQVGTSDDDSIHFEPLPYGADTPAERTVHSVNKIKVKNVAEGGANLWMFVAGTNLYDPLGASLCPDTNYIFIESKDFNGDGTDELAHHLMQYRGWSGTNWQMGEGWNDLYIYNLEEPCNIATCYGGTPVPAGVFHGGTPLDNILTNQGTLEIEFKLTYPMPCIGSFSQGTIYIFGKVI